MEQVKVLDWLLEIDKEMTISVYNQLPTTAEDCPCSYCKNYVAASTSFPAEFLSLLDDLGVDPSKASEVYEVCENENGTHLYGGFTAYINMHWTRTDEYCLLLINSAAIAINQRGLCFLLFFPLWTYRTQ